MTETQLAPHGQYVTVTRPGGSETLRVTQQDELHAPSGCAVIRNTAVGVNFIDIYHRTGFYPRQLPFTPGVEGAGVIETAEDLPPELRVGDRVGYIGPFGSYADRTIVPVNRLIPLPADVSDETAAATLLQGITTHALLEQVHVVQPGQTIVVHAAAGGLGLLMCQWATSSGVTVIGTVSSAGKAATAAAHGCTHPILHSEPEWPERVRRITDGVGVPVVYDSIGRDTFAGSLAALAVRGLLVSVGQSSGPPDPLDVTSLGQRGSLSVTRPSVFDFVRTRDELLVAAERLFTKLRDGDLRAPLHHSYPLHNAAAAHTDLEQRRTTGSLILLPS